MKFKIKYSAHRRSPSSSFYASEILNANGIVHAHKLAKEHAKKLHPNCQIDSIHVVEV